MQDGPENTNSIEWVFFIKIGASDEHQENHSERGICMPIKETITLIWNIFLYILTKTLYQNTKFQEGQRNIFKMSSYVFLVLSILFAFFAGMKWFIYLVETFGR